MIKLLICSHGPLAEALIESVKVVYGEVEDIKSLCLYPEDSIDEFEKELIEYCEKTTPLLALCDMLGGSPCLCLARTKVPTIVGMNLPTLLEVICQRECYEDPQALLEAVLGQCHNSVISLREIE